MIIVRLMGGLGNQMFQYAAGKRLAEINNTELKLDLTWFKESQDPGAPAVRHYELGCFVLKPQFASIKDLARVETKAYSFKRKLYRNIRGYIKVFREPDNADFLPELLRASNNSFLDGYWQSDKYFADAVKAIRQEFKFKAPLSGLNADLAKQIQDSSSVSIHVRRGDYASNATINAMHGLLEQPYYKAAILLIKKKVKNPTFYLFSDDPEWCKTNLQLPVSTVYVDHNKKGSDDLRLMSLCKHHIIANSSFSWWGAWLNPSKSKIVCAPKKWFNNTNMSLENRLPESWIKI